jgi:hypothetical protein
VWASTVRVPGNGLRRCVGHGRPSHGALVVVDESGEEEGAVEVGVVVVDGVLLSI